MNRVKYLIAAPVLRTLDYAESVLSGLAARADALYVKVWIWTQR
jgi:hypothetical protein